MREDERCKRMFKRLINEKACLRKSWSHNWKHNSYFCVCISLPLFAFAFVCVRRVTRETDGEKKQYENTLSVCWICSPITNQRGVWTLILLTCVDCVFRLFDWQGHIQVSMPIWGTRSCFWYDMHTCIQYIQRLRNTTWGLFWGSCPSHDHIGWIGAI